MEEKVKKNNIGGFDTSFYESDFFTNDNINFHSEEFIEDGEHSNPEVAFVSAAILKDIDNIVDSDFMEFKDFDIKKLKRLNKVGANKIFKIMKEKLSEKYTVVEMWYYLAYYFNANADKVYDILNDEYKNDLIEYLANNTNLLNKKNLNSVF